MITKTTRACFGGPAKITGPGALMGNVNPSLRLLFWKARDVTHWNKGFERLIDVNRKVIVLYI